MYSKEIFEKSSSRDLLDLKCEQCNIIFKKIKKIILESLKDKSKNRLRFCSSICCSKNQTKKQIVQCKKCGNFFKKKQSELRKTSNSFCNRSCSASYNNTHKTKGTRRSKLEKYLENELSKIFPSVVFLFNEKKAIGSELDIYIPQLQLAFEINGIFHYKPIYGCEKFFKIQKNDSIKKELCFKNKIELHEINISEMKHFKKTEADNYLLIIKNIIENKWRNISELN